MADLFDVVVARKLSGGGGGGGSSDFSTAEVTITLSRPDSYAEWFAPMIVLGDLTVGESLTTEESVTVSESYTVVLYNNNPCAVEFFDSEQNTYTDISVTGDIEVNNMGAVVISGDGTITIS